MRGYDGKPRMYQSTGPTGAQAEATLLAKLNAKMASDPVGPRACVLDAPLIEGLLGNLQFMADLLGRHPLIYETGTVVSGLVLGVLATNFGPFQALFWRSDDGGRVAVVQAVFLSPKDILPREYDDLRPK